MIKKKVKDTRDRRQYYKDNKDRILKKQKSWYKRTIKKRHKQQKLHRQKSVNKKKAYEKNKLYRQNNPEKYRKLQRDWKLKNIEKMRKYHREYGRKHRIQRLFYSLNRRAEKKGLLVISKNEFINWYNNQNKKCYYCDISEDKLILNSFNNQAKRCSRGLSIDRVDNNKGYVIRNMVLSCFLCNSVKSNIFTGEEMLKIGKVIKLKYKKSLKELSKK